MLAKAGLLLAMLGGSGLALSAEEEYPELEFLEYLGMWEETDEEWLMVDALVTAEKDVQPQAAAPEEEAPVEKDDES